jgi:hypothetical protein
MNILQQYKKAVQERDNRLGAGWIGVWDKFEIGEEFEFYSGNSRKFLVGDRLTLCYQRMARECIFGEAKVIRRIDEEKVILRRVS